MDTPPQPPPLSSLLTKVSLLWVKQTTLLYRPLSTNIVREVAVYISPGFPPLTPSLALFPSILLHVDPKWSLWKRVAYLSQPITVDRSSSVLLIPPFTVFVCGGCERTMDLAEVSTPCAYLIYIHCVTVLPAMSTPRAGAGVVHDPSNDTVYVFGGANLNSNISCRVLIDRRKLQSSSALLVSPPSHGLPPRLLHPLLVPR